MRYLLLLLATITTTTWAYSTQSDKYAMAIAEMFQKGINRDIATGNPKGISGPAAYDFKYEACDGKNKNAAFYAKTLMGYGPIGKVLNARSHRDTFEVVIYQVRYGERTNEVMIRESGMDLKWYLARAQEMIC